MRGLGTLGGSGSWVGIGSGHRDLSAQNSVTNRPGCDVPHESTSSVGVLPPGRSVPRATPVPGWVWSHLWILDPNMGGRAVWGPGETKPEMFSAFLPQFRLLWTRSCPMTSGWLCKGLESSLVPADH